MDPGREPIVNEEVLVEKSSRGVCRLVPRRYRLGVSRKVVRYFKHVLDASLGRLCGQIVNTDYFHWSGRGDVDEIRCSGRQDFPANTSTTLLYLAINKRVHPRPV